MMKKLATLIMLFSVGILESFAQTQNPVEMATGLRSSGKIYVVVLVITLLFTGLFIYLASIDRKVKKLENKKQL